MDDQNEEGSGQQWLGNDPHSNQHNPSTPATGLHQRGNDTSRNTDCSGRQNAATRHSMRREERVTVQGPVKKQQPDGMSHRGLAKWLWACKAPGCIAKHMPNPLSDRRGGSLPRKHTPER